MGKSIIMHIDEAPWIEKRPTPPGDSRERGSQLIGDLEKGPWIHIESLEPGHVAQPHAHSQDEVIYITEGEITLGDRTCGPGTVIFLERDTEYGFTVSANGVRFLIIRPGLATAIRGGKTMDLRDYYRRSPPDDEGKGSTSSR